MPRYKITYPSYGVVQTKRLISHDDYMNGYKPAAARIAELEQLMSEINRKKKKEAYAELKAEHAALKDMVKKAYGNFFTDDSPLWISQFNGGIMELPAWCGGKIEVQLQKLD